MALLSGDNDHVISSVSGISYGYMEHKNMMVMMEKRQLFLRSYQFCRKRTLTERIKRSLVGVKRVMWLRLRSARKLKRLVLSRLRFAFLCRGRKRRYIRLKNNHFRHTHNSCLW
ncbi:hypothetical protein CXB51_034545 [Gossypium anomalum]|nr:uncharacterized protein LOC108463441 [Gossypium arboreum]KAB1995046.1 hypothetical protein ES319_D13G134700v1 [Gossypium barbadense]KAG4166169.1 hypothetical protein ERO13_A13G114400v2 [Gossypium hirsutum]KAG8472655.1 hypothetical protein CXB51_034545 [Gossypium anomalum]TYG86478.1 hypothetical protein ES288_A13G137000v1 [Gossypium darwinii]TYH34715.1 hypothetical protein ES332_D13G144000v1 [Gossypium tomentosum]TYI46929.1 hypothetical protein E1A91_D13G137800v1 [Gossypium mustelinum]